MKTFFKITILSLLAFALQVSKGQTPSCTGSSSITHIISTSEMGGGYVCTWNTSYIGFVEYSGGYSDVYDISIEIPSGYTLTIDGLYLYFAQNVQIIVDNGAQLKLTGGTKLSAYNAGGTCNHLWGGIIVHGNVSSSQSSSTGSLYMNNSTIDLANEGVDLGDGSYTDNGGIIQAEYSSFSDCHRCVEFLSYSHTNASYFTGCQFSCSLLLPDYGTDWYAAVTMDDVGPIIFKGCTFVNNEPTKVGTDRGYGIIALDAKFTIDEDWTCTGGSPTDWRVCQTCAVVSPQVGPSYFSDLYCGIQNSEPFYSGDITPDLNILNSIFTDNIIDIQDNTSVLSFFRNDRFIITSLFPTYSGALKHYTIQENGSSKIDISNNFLEVNVPSLDADIIGIEIKNCGSASESSIYQNSIHFWISALNTTTSRYYTGIHLLGENGSNGGATGLHINNNTINVLPEDNAGNYAYGTGYVQLRDMVIEWDPSNGSTSNIYLPDQSIGGISASNDFSDYTFIVADALATYGVVIHDQLENVVIIDNSSATIPYHLNYYNYNSVIPPFGIGYIPPYVFTPSGTVTLIPVSSNPTYNASLCANFNYSVGDIHEFIFPKQSNNDSISFYPNPASNKLNFAYNFPSAQNNIIGEQYILEIYDIFGNLYYFRNLPNVENSENLISINSTNWENGIYLFRFIGKEGVLKQGKLIVQK